MRSTPRRAGAGRPTALARALVAVGLAALLAAGCSDSPEQAQAPTDSPTEAATGSASEGDTSVPAAGDGSPAATSPAPTSEAPVVADPEHAVEPPGRLEDRLWRPDILIFGQDQLSDEMVRSIRKLDGVAAVEQIGLGQVTIENRALTIAAVDPATYRQFTPQPTAHSEEVWQRVAGGELAITPALGKKLQDDQGYLTLGSSEDAPRIHVGALAPQAEQIDIVVNQTWVEDMGTMVSGNGLLISTDEIDPSEVRKPIQRIVGDRASVQNLDIASRLGLDPNVEQTAFLTGGSVADLVGTFNYRVLGGGRIAPDPAWVRNNIATEAVPILGSVTCHKDLFPQLRAALLEIQGDGLADEIHPEEFAGCYYPRFIAGTTTLSNHSFGLALDLNVPGNLRGTVGEIDRDVVAIFKKWGFAWGGDWNYTDPMHFEMNRIVRPG